MQTFILLTRKQHETDERVLPVISAGATKTTAQWVVERTVSLSAKIDGEKQLWVVEIRGGCGYILQSIQGC
jgi:hypothetical protein